MYKKHIEISKILDKHLPAKGINTKREKLRMMLHRDIMIFTDQLINLQWIKCSDELPEDGSDLLFYTEGLWYKGFYQDGLWYSENGSLLGRIPKCWQIPQPPKDQ